MIWRVDGVRLDRGIADWRAISRAAALRLLDQQAVRRNGSIMRRSNKGDLLRVGDELAIDPAYAKQEAPMPDASIKLDVLQRGDDWLVVDKPAGIPVRPHALDEIGTIINAVVAMEPGVVGVGEGGLRSGVVHRLDNDTSGVLLVATSQAAWHRLRDAFSEHRISKRYLALVQGVPGQTGSAMRELSVSQHRPAKVKVESQGKGGPDARACSLSWRVVEVFGVCASLVEVDLHTGFLHQVRAMMSDLGHAVVGDDVYGDTDAVVTAGRQMLHAKSIVFEDVNAEAGVPADMDDLIQLLRQQTM